MLPTELECLFSGDKFERCMRQCIVFPADGSATRIAHMIVETVTATQDVSALRLHSRCVDLTSTFGAEHRDLKTRVMVLSASHAGDTHAYLFYYNRSLRLPINLNVAKLVGISPTHLKNKEYMFWRGDVVVIKVKQESEAINSMVKALDADLSELGTLEEFLRTKHREGFLAQELNSDEMRWKSYVQTFGESGYPIASGPKSYWGENAAQKEENFLSDINEQLSAVGRTPLPRPAHMKTAANSGLLKTIYSSFRSAFRYLVGQKPAGLPKLPPELERQIFETCAFDCPEVCTNLVLVCKRVYIWLDPILITTVCITDDSQSQRGGKMKSFLSKLTSGNMPAEYYAQYVKNLAIFCGLHLEGEINRVLAICTGVENLVIKKMVIEDEPVKSLSFLKNSQAGASLKRLYVNLSLNTSGAVHKPIFARACFRNLTHLHLEDDDDDWAFVYRGWKHLTCLTHLALACPGSPAQLRRVMRELPVIQYVAIGHYGSNEPARRLQFDVVINNIPLFRVAWDVRVVFLDNLSIPRADWERGARGKGDFWHVVEDEVERRLQNGSSDLLYF